MSCVRAVCMGKDAGEILRSPGCGRILSVFRLGWYLETGGTILLIHDRKNGEIPFGIGVEEFERYVPYERFLEGEEVRWAEGTLYFPGVDLGVDFRSAVSQDKGDMFTPREIRWFGRNAGKYAGAAGHGVLFLLLPEAKRLLWGEEKSREESAAGGCSKDCAGRKIELFFQSLREENPEKIYRSLRAMLGLGTGLTPAMDDWLVGFLYMLLRGPSEIPGKNTVECICRAILRLAPERTNRISASYLKAAAEGRYFEVLHRAVRCPRKESLDALCDIGHSSGTDMLTGMLFAAFYMEL